MTDRPDNRVERRKHQIRVSLWEYTDWQDEHYNEIADAASRCFEREFDIFRQSGRQRSEKS